MSLRARIFVVVSLVVLLVLGISIFLIISAKQKAAQEQIAQNPTTTTGSVVEKDNFNSAQLGQGATTVTPGMPVKKLTSVEVEQNGVEQLAKIFAERYGTYSTDSNFQNIKDVQDLVTPSLWSKLKAKITTGPAANFVGATAKVITSNLSDWDGASATVQMQATVVKEQNGVSTTLHQNVTVSMVKNGSSWLVSDFVWK